MKQSEIMRKKLYELVIPVLSNLGYVDKYPMFYKKDNDFYQLIYIGPAKGGNAVTIEASYVYLDKPRDKNNVHKYYKGDIESITPADCIEWYLLKSKHKLFYYTDVYKKIFGGIQYYGVSEEKVKNFKKPFFHIKVQEYSSNIYENICREINHKMGKVFKWLDSKNPKLKNNHG